MNKLRTLFLLSIFTSSWVLADCQQVSFRDDEYTERSNLTSLTISDTSGLSFILENELPGRDGGRQDEYYKFSLPLTIDNKPNPMFDRIYALMMRLIDSRLDFRVCTQSRLNPFVRNRYDSFNLETLHSHQISAISISYNIRNRRPHPVKVTNQVNLSQPVRICH